MGALTAVVAVWRQRRAGRRRLSLPSSVGSTMQPQPSRVLALAAHHRHDAGAPQQHGAARIIQCELEAGGTQLKGRTPIDALPLLQRLRAWCGQQYAAVGWISSGGEGGGSGCGGAASGAPVVQRQLRSTPSACRHTLRMKSRSLLDSAASASRCNAAKAPAIGSDGPQAASRYSASDARTANVRAWPFWLDSFPSSGAAQHAHRESWKRASATRIGTRAPIAAHQDPAGRARPTCTAARTAAGSEQRAQRVVDLC